MKYTIQSNVVPNEFGSITPRTYGHKLYKRPDTAQAGLYANKLGTLVGRVKADSQQVMQLNAVDLSNQSHSFDAFVDITALTKALCEFSLTKALLSNEQDKIIFEMDYQENIRSKDLTKVKVDTAYDAGVPLVKRFGINADQLGYLTGTKLLQNELHEIEKVLVNEAKAYLATKASAENLLTNRTLLHPNNVVLVDIFVRETDTIKKAKEGNLPETHTIVLFKQKDNEMLLIDPSQVSFSSDLKVSLANILGNTVEVHTYQGQILYGTGGKKTGYDDLMMQQFPHQHRDCVDIAVKIGFELNALQIDHSVSTTKQLLDSMNLQISNKKEVATYLTKDNGIANRASQSTNLQIRRINRFVLENYNRK